ncbi:MAG: single-stranded DNA-binding protein [Acidimicrobiia bacterium]|jgi:single-stranded DNA-binding protein
MDLNVVVLCGALAAPPEERVFDSGSRMVRYLVTVRSERPQRRVDVLPVTLWDPPDDLLSEDPEPGRRVWVAGSLQRRFWDGEGGRRSRLEVIAGQVTLRSPADRPVGAPG